MGDEEPERPCGAGFVAPETATRLGPAEVGRRLRRWLPEGAVVLLAFPGVRPLPALLERSLRASGDWPPRGAESRLDGRELRAALGPGLEWRGAFALGVNYGLDNKKTYDNEFSASWEKRLPSASSFNVTFLVKRTWDFQGSDDSNIVRDASTGAFLGRPFPAFDAVLRTYAPNYSFQQFRSLQFLYTKNFGQRWGMNANYWYGMHQSIQLKFNPTRDILPYLGFTTEDATNNWVTPLHQSRISSFIKLPYGVMVSGVYSFTAGPHSDVLTGNAPLNSTAPTIVLSNGRTVSDPFYTGTAANAFPRAGKRGVDMLIADNVHLVNLRAQKSFDFGRSRKIELTADGFNLFNSDAAFGFLSADARSGNFGIRTNFVQPRVGQLGVRFVF